MFPTAPEVCRHPLIHACPAHAQVTRVPAARGSSMAPFTSQVAELVQPYLTRGDLRSLQNVGPRAWVAGRFRVLGLGFRFRFGALWFLGFRFRVLRLLGFRFRVFRV